MKTCSKCKLEQSLTEFNKSKVNKDGLEYQCKSCKNSFNAEWRKRNKERIREQKISNSQKLRLKARYGLTLEAYQEMIVLQDNCCAICSKQFSEKVRSVVDHCHNSLKVRGLLCYACNTGLGHIEREGFVELALKYLEESRGSCL